MKIINGLVYTDKQYIEMLEKRIEEIKSQKEICDNLLETTHVINDTLQQKIDKAIEYIGNGNLGIPRKTREKFIKILKGEVK